MKKLTLGALLTITMLGCTPSHESLESVGFSLPEGDIENGELLLNEFNCYGCHTMQGTEFLGDEWRLTEDDGIAVELGGVKTSVLSYGDLVTSIINPSHRIAEGYSPEEVMTEEGESRMAYYNSVMTVEELIDIVTYLKTKYELDPHPRTLYPEYIHPGMTSGRPEQK